MPHQYHAILSGCQETVPVETKAEGTFTACCKAKYLKYKLSVSNIKNVTAVYLCLGRQFQTGIIAAVLYRPDSPVTVKGEAVLSKGKIRTSDLQECMCLRDLIDLIECGRVYVNVITCKHPNGEIRGQVQQVPTQVVFQDWGI